MQVVGGLPTGTKDLYEAREQVKTRRIRQLLPHSKDGVPIAPEPPDDSRRSPCLCTLRQALDWCVMNSIPMVSLALRWWWMFITSGGSDLASQILRAGVNASAFHMLPIG